MVTVVPACLLPGILRLTALMWPYLYALSSFVQVMTPTDLVDPAFPLTTVAEAQALLAGGGGASAPAPAPEA